MHQNVDNSVINSNSEFTLSEKRRYPRSDIRLPVWLMVIDPSNKKHKIHKFESINISREGLAINPKSYPFKISQWYNLLILYTLKDNVIKIYNVDACCKHINKEICGFRFLLKWKYDKE